MEHVISNGIISLTVNEQGAEMMSAKKDGAEYLWQGDSTYWSGRAYHLFPICGRLTDGKYTYKGKTYEMTLHGFVKLSLFSLTEKTDSSLTFSLKSNGETKKMYPFDFEYTVKYTLDKNRINVATTVQNTGNEKMIFTLGEHPGFNVPLNGDGDFSDWYIEFNEPCAPNALVFDGCYMSDKTVPFNLINNGFALSHSLFDNDAIFLSDASKSVTLKSKKSLRSVTVNYPNMKYVGFWHTPKTEAPFVCIEPWIGVPAYNGIIDDFETKRDMLELSENNIYQIQTDIVLE